MRWVLKQGSLNLAIVEGRANLMKMKAGKKDDFLLEFSDAGHFYIMAARNGSNFDWYAFGQYEWNLLPENLLGVFLAMKPVDVATEPPPKKKKAVEEYPYKR